MSKLLTIKTGENFNHQLLSMVEELELRVRCLIEWSMEPMSKLYLIPFPNLPTTLFEATLITPSRT